LHSESRTTPRRFVMAIWNQLWFQDAASPTITRLLYLHDLAILIIFVVLTFVAYGLYCVTTNPMTCRTIYEAQRLETVWTIAPIIILLYLAMPSISILYTMDEINRPIFTFKAIGHQWYWSYEYSDLGHTSFDAYIVQTEDLSSGDYRLLEVDHRTVLPMKTQLRGIITSADVIHSWAIPSLAIKVDAVPGRLNQTPLMANRPGVFYGQCSEICGANHSFIPIVLEIVSYPSFIQWLNTYNS